MLRLPCTPRVSDRSAASQVIEAETRATTRWELSAEGEEVLRDGSPEVRLFRSVPSEGLPQSDAMVSTAMGGRGGVCVWGGGGALTARKMRGPPGAPLSRRSHLLAMALLKPTWAPGSFCEVRGER